MIMELFERLSGARMHTAVYRPFGFGSNAQLSSLSRDALGVTQRGARVIGGAFLGLLNNRAMRSRCSGVGSFSVAKVSSYGIQGVIARASGVPVDARLGLGLASYGAYGSYSFRSFLGKRGDCYDRFVVRAREMLESFHILTQALVSVDIAISSHSLASVPAHRPSFVSMEGVIAHFVNAVTGAQVSAGLGMAYVEGPKGVVSVCITATGAPQPYRLHVKSPVAHNLHLLSTAANGYTFADFVATFCSMDVVLGEIDR